eukprot:Plantae.Rhodophyta-Hildenbrandia_rubra.ctg10421.p1 GENE.Plantae.Rhodophyta-Hildenbrandia_rubra.ctg10421~~Plantae.Rhodophyta-Hildenbrandia_rubra.ctg10421.p1  ORF type:complete len:392 (-),score=96.93 Plantae.Rhodophyta-Hildenbrandia_rubra.ctg10421:2284-3459(-)
MASPATSDDTASDIEEAGLEKIPVTSEDSPLSLSDAQQEDTELWLVRVPRGLLDRGQLVRSNIEINEGGASGGVRNKKKMLGCYVAEDEGKCPGMWGAFVGDGGLGLKKLERRVEIVYRAGSKKGEMGEKKVYPKEETGLKFRFWGESADSRHGGRLPERVYEEENGIGDGHVDGENSKLNGYHVDDYGGGVDDQEEDAVNGNTENQLLGKRKAIESDQVKLLDQDHKERERKKVKSEINLKNSETPMRKRHSTSAALAKEEPKTHKSPKKRKHSKSRTSIEKNHDEAATKDSDVRVKVEVENGDQDDRSKHFTVKKEAAVKGNMKIDLARGSGLNKKGVDEHHGKDKKRHKSKEGKKKKKEHKHKEHKHKEHKHKKHKKHKVKKEKVEPM